jgi:hypothetical protein
MDAAQIKQRWDEADAAEQRGESLHWAVARELSEAAEGGASHRELGKATKQDYVLERVDAALAARKGYVARNSA